MRSESLNNGEPKECLEDLENIVTNFPNSKLNHLAGNIINGVKAGRKLQGGKFDMSKNVESKKRSVEQHRLNRC